MDTTAMNADEMTGEQWSVLYILIFGVTLWHLCIYEAGKTE